MALIHRPTREALRRTALAGLTAAALALSLAGCGGGGVGGSNYTHVEGYFLTPSGGLLQIPSQEQEEVVKSVSESNVTVLTPINGVSTTEPYFLEMNSHSGDVSNGIQVSATSVSSFTNLPNGQQLVANGGYLVKSTTGVTVNNPLTISLGFSALPTSGLASLRIVEFVDKAWLTLPNYDLNPPASDSDKAYSADASFQTLPGTITAQFPKFDPSGTTYFAVVYTPTPPATTLGPFFGTYQITFTPTPGTTVPPPVYVDAGAEDANSSNAALTSDSANPTTDAVTGAINSSGTVSDFTIKEGGVTYTLTGNFTPGTSTTQPTGSGSYTGAGASGTWKAAVQ